ncbi:hypothetical protein [Vibrio campbellii]|uniref:hypothetical protein n=1 Tax=Vibrio campbellii TaxID=680 RepID=UPI00249A1E63|nr:hypothetical protein [Vibrio campbellii]
MRNQASSMITGIALNSNSRFKSLPKDEMKITGSQVIELQAKPFRKPHLTHLKEVWENKKRAIPFRDLAVLILSYGALLREGEVRKIHKNHLKFLENGDLNIERVTSKQPLVLSLSV